MAWASAASAPASASRKKTQEPFAEALDEAGLGHELQMPADARLALAEDLGQVLDVQLAAGQQRQDAQPRRLAGAAQGGKRVDAGQAWARGLGSLVDLT